MNENFEIALVIVDPQLENQVTQELSNAELAVHGRYLRIDDIDAAKIKSTILIISKELSVGQESQSSFALFPIVIALSESTVPGAISISENDLASLVRVIMVRLNQQEESADLECNEDANINKVVSSGYQLHGVTPRVGVSMIARCLEQCFSDELFVWRAKQNGKGPVAKILCSEVDDDSLRLLFATLEAEVSGITAEKVAPKLGVLFNKVSRNRIARLRLRAIEQELDKSGVQIVATIPFDERMQITGDLGATTQRAIRSLFDWITKAN